MDVEALYAAVFAAPADDGPRLVLADALQERGDPRGEFISLQLQSPRAQRSERRMQKLLERHRGSFLRRLQPVVMPDSAQRWDRGFLSEAAVVLHGEQVDAPDWATVRKLDVLFSGTPPLELASPHLRSLQEISNAPLEVVPVLFAADRPVSVEAVTLQGPVELQAWPSPEVELIGRARSLPSLSRLTLRYQAPMSALAEWVWRMPVLERLKSLEFAGAFRGVPLEPLLSVLRQLDTAPAAVVFHASGVKLRLKRDDGFRSLVVELEPFSGVVWLDSMLWSIPPDSFDEVLITATQPLEVAHVAMLKRALKRLKLRSSSLPASSHSRMK
ncbi:MAG: TIGR02996 domain-containing protein [Archangium sp.]|nr:TIGR02996 domain-containing protein [Archangium sp.]